MFFHDTIKRRALRLLPFLLTLLIIPSTFLFLDNPPGYLVGDVSESTAKQYISRLEYLFTEFRVIVTYTRLLFLPVSQNLDYDYPINQSFFEPQVLLSFLFLFSLIGLGIYMLQRSRKGETAARLIAFGIFWFFLSLSVESGIIPLHVINEHRVYLPSAGFFSALSTTLFVILEKIDGKKIQKAVIGIFLLVLLTLASATYARNSVWKSEKSLWEDVISKSPGKATAHYNLALAYGADGLTDKAIEHYTTAIRLKPDLEEAHYNLGNVFKAEGLLDKAIEHYTTAIRLKPDYAEPHNNLGTVYRALGLVDKAIAHYQAAIRIWPGYADPHNNLGFIYFYSKGDVRKAIEHYEAALRLKPYNAKTHLNLGITYKAKGMADKASAHFDKARELNPALFTME
jgi:Flp pilus assembly protein TadD